MKDERAETESPGPKSPGGAEAAQFCNVHNCQNICPWRGRRTRAKGLDVSHPYITGTVGNHFSIGAPVSHFGRALRRPDERFSGVTQFILRAKK